MAGFRPADAAALARDHYAVLGVYEPADCTPEEALAHIQAAACVGLDELKTLYHQAALQWHPGDNRVRISIRGNLLKQASSSAFSQEDLGAVQSAELSIVGELCQTEKWVRILLPPDGRCFFHMLKAQIEDATHKGDAQDVDVPTSAVLEAQIAEATHKGDAQEVDVPSSAVLEAYAHDLPLPMTSYLMSQRCEVSCGVYPFGDPHGMTNYLMSQQHEVSCGGYRFPDPHGITSYPISTPFLNYLMIEDADIPIRLSSSAVLQACSKVQSLA